jgi:hypothetical protein
MKLKIIYGLAVALMLLAMVRCAPHCWGDTARITGSGTTSDGRYTFSFDQIVTLTPATQPTAPATQPVVVVVPPAKPVRPGADSTRPVGILANAPANFVLTPGQTYRNLRILGSLDFNVPKGAAITFEDCEFDGGFDGTYVTVNGKKVLKGSRYLADCSDNKAGGQVIFRRCELKRFTSAAIWGSNYQAIGCYVHHSAGDGFKADANVLIQGCYLTSLGMSDGAHADGVQIRGGHDIKIVGNFFDMPKDVAGTSTNAAMFLQLDSRNVSFAGNWCLGGNFTVCAYPDVAPKTISVTGNTFYPGTPRYGFGNIFDGVVWSGNVTDGGKPATPQMK